MRVRLLIDGVDRTAALLKEWEIEGNAFGALDNCSFTLNDPTNAITPSRGKVVIVENWNDATERFFGGVLTEVQGQAFGVGRRWNCKAIDWTFLLERALASEKYYGKSDAYIINNTSGTPKGVTVFSGSSGPCDTDLSDFDFSANVQTGIANTQFMAFKRESIRDILDALADQAGFIWYIDQFKKLHYKAFGTEGHAFYMSDAPDESTTFHYAGMRIMYDLSKVVNRITVEGGWRRELNQSRIYGQADGVDGVRKIWGGLDHWQAKEGQTRILVYRNTGTEGAPVWTAQTVELDSSAAPAADVYWTPGRWILRWTTAPPNNATNSFKVEADRLIPILHIESDWASILSLGRVYGLSVRDMTIVSEEVAELRALAELRKRRAEAEQVVFRTTKDGIKHGRSLRFVSAAFGIDKSYLVKRVNTRLLGGTVAEYQVTLAVQP